MSVFQRVQTLIAVEIGNDWLKIVEARVSVRGIVFSDGYFVKLSDIKNSVLDTLSAVIKDKKWDKLPTVTYLPRHLVTLRVLELPTVNPKEVKSIIDLHIGQQTPYSREEIVYSHQLLASEKKGYTRAVLVIARRNLIDERVDILMKASMNLKTMGLSSEGLLHWFNKFHGQDYKLTEAQGVLLIDIDSNYADCIIVHKRCLRFSKNILMGANHLIEDKKASSDKFMDEIAHALTLFREEAQGIEIVQICLSGAALNVGDLDKRVNARFHLPCVILDPLKNLTLKDKELALRQETRFISLTPMIGVLAQCSALDFDLMPQERRMGQIMEEKRKHLTITGVLFCAILVMLSVWLGAYINIKNTYMDALKQRIAAIKNVSDTIDQMRLSVDLVHEHLDASGDVLNLLNEITQAIPATVYLTSVDVTRKGQLVLKGNATAIADVFRFVSVLSASPFLEKVRNTYATAKEDNNSPYADFEITAAYKHK